MLGRCFFFLLTLPMRFVLSIRIITTPQANDDACPSLKKRRFPCRVHIEDRLLWLGPGGPDYAEERRLMFGAVGLVAVGPLYPKVIMVQGDVMVLSCASVASERVAIRTTCDN